MSNSRDDGSANQRGSTNQSVGSQETNSSDDRSATAKAAAWVSRIMTISMEMVVPGLIGYWLDIKLGTKFVLMLAGFVFGVTAAIKHLLYLTQKDLTQKDLTQKDLTQKKLTQKKIISTNTDTPASQITTPPTKPRKEQEP